MRRTLKRAEKDVQDLKDAHKRAADIVAARAEQTAPVGPPSVHVRDTIRTSGTASAAIVRAGGAKAPYAKAVHWGHRHYAKHKAPEKVAARPWIYDAAKETSDRWLPEYLQELQAICDRVEGTNTP